MSTILHVAKHLSTRPRWRSWTGLVACVLLAGCKGADDAADRAPTELELRLERYASVELSPDLSSLSPNELRMLPLLIEAAEAMDDGFWFQTWGNRETLLDPLTDPLERRLAEINYGPWDRLDDDTPFVEGFEPRPPGANFYPPDMSRAEFEASVRTQPELADLYTVVRRNRDGRLTCEPYHEVYADQVETAAAKLRAAAALADAPGQRRYLEARADALLSDDYLASDLAWMDMRDNLLDIVIGPIETYEDQLFGYKAAFASYVLIKDREWSARLSRYGELLPGLQAELPVPEAYRREEPGTDADLGAYDAIYFAGEANVGAKAIAFNLPNDEAVQLERGTRRVQLKNVMRAKFDRILKPIARELIDPAQRSHVSFDAFFANTMFHEIAHGLGIKYVLRGEQTVREALQAHADTIEEAKADLLGLFMVTRLHEQGELGQTLLEDYYVTFLAGVFRSVRFGATSAHGRANMIRFNFFREQGAFSRNPSNGAYRVEMEAMREAIDRLSARLLRLQGDGDYDAVDSFVREQARIDAALQRELDRLAHIPEDIVFEQGLEMLTDLSKN